MNIVCIILIISRHALRGVLGGPSRRSGPESIKLKMYNYTTSTFFATTTAAAVSENDQEDGLFSFS